MRHSRVQDHKLEGELFTIAGRPAGATGDFWSSLKRIKDKDDLFEPFVQCSVCDRLFVYEPKNGTTTLSLHVQNCLKQEKTLKSQPPISTAMKTTTTINSDEKRSVTIACAKYCAFDLKSCNSVDDQGFQQLCQKLIDIGYKYGGVRSGLPNAKDFLPDPTNISRTVKQLAEQYRVKLKDLLQQDLKKIKLFSVTLDYWKNENENHLRCICHGINLVVLHSLSACLLIDELITSCRVLSSHFKRCELNHLLPSILKHDNDTRWNSIYEMMNSISINYKHIEGVLDGRGGDESEKLDNIGHQLVTQLCDVLLPFKLGSERFQADLEPTLHLVLPWITKLKQHCTKDKEGDLLPIIQLKKELSLKLDEKTYLTQIHYIATFLHPITKNLSQLSSTKREKVHVDIMAEFANENQDVRDSDDEKDEIEQYLKTKMKFTNEDKLLGWWKKHSLIYPQLSILAQTLFGVPSSSATAERVFSSSGRILEKRRQSLSGDTVDDLLFLRNFRKI
ncbi:unnamed protein product [Didymodactylos carnosus]|uniref:HAT C-terminal dimerisation domain-containing protein n=1 Tax=Didymodactylos carnosus TaxID=1234261 RepID=A0A813TNR3_9BILA|nr:unnamed protein product [Didymodactylos carnosus]CAF3597427.1 unnamed protein product [Didymodactylos carnosus]